MINLNDDGINSVDQSELFSAAPEMLITLRAILKSWDDATWLEDPFFEGIRELIAKATGGEKP